MHKKTGFLYKIVAVVILALLLLSVFMSTFTILRVHSTLRDSLYSQLNKAYDGTAHLFDIYKRNALGFAKTVAANPEIIEAAKAKDAQKLFSVATPLANDAGLEYMVITDEKGFVIIRTHQPGVIPAPDDSIANQLNVQHALRGESYVTIEQGKVVFLSVRAGAPIRDADGTVIGACSTGYVLSENTIAQDIKQTFDVDCAIYLRDTIVSSTFDVPDGSRFQEFTGKGDEICARVMEKGETVNDITFIGETNYLTAIGPLVGADDTIVGMIEASMPESVLENRTDRMIQVVLLGSFLIIALMILITILVFRKLLGPIDQIASRLFEVADGDLSGKEMPVTSSDELGALVHAGNEMQEKLRCLVSDVIMASDRVATASEELDASAQQMEQRSFDITERIRDVSDDVEALATKADSFYGVRESLRKTKEEFLVMSETMAEISRAAGELAGLSEEMTKATGSFKL